MRAREPEPKSKPKGPPETDLRPISRDSDRCLSTVYIELDWETKVKWLTFGQAQLVHQSDTSYREQGRWRLEAHMGMGATDFEHDSAYALRLPLIGVHFCGIRYQQTHIVAWVDPNLNPTDRSNDFHVPGPGYDPTKLPEAHVCKLKECRKPHPIVPQGHYVPPFNADLYQLVRGKRVEITIGVILKSEEE